MAALPKAVQGIVKRFFIIAGALSLIGIAFFRHRFSAAPFPQTQLSPLTPLAIASENTNRQTSVTTRPRLRRHYLRRSSFPTKRRSLRLKTFPFGQIDFYPTTPR